MGLSLRARAYLAKLAEEKAARRAAEQAAAEKSAADFHRDFLDRERAAAACGVSVHKFKRWQLAGQGPRPCKMGGNKQSRVFWQRAEVAAFVANPTAYNAARAADGGD